MPQGNNTRRKRKASKPKTVAGLKRMIKSVSLKDQETKLSSNSDENVRLFHNGTEYRLQLLRTTQGTANPNGFLENTENRIGDVVLARGIKFRFWFSNQQDRPNVMYRVYVFWYNSNNANLADNQFWRGTDGDGAQMNRMIDAANADKVKPLREFVVKSTQDYTTSGNGKEHSYFRELYIPLNNKKIQYRADGSSRPEFQDIGFCVVPYDTFGTLTTDLIGTMAYSHTFYYKDA